jgi:polyferredoxin
MKNLINKKPVKIALITLILLVFLISLLPQFGPILNIVRMLVGSAMIGWWTGTLCVKIWNK